MSEQEESSSPRHGSDPTLQNSLDDSANNSIIGKVKSKVSSILPNRLSQWFSPSSKLQNDSLNGSIGEENMLRSTRRKRRTDIEDEEHYEDEVLLGGEYKERQYRIFTRQERILHRDIDVDIDCPNSENEYACNSIKQSKSDLNMEREPPMKKSRLNIAVQDTPIISRDQPLLSSTPDVCSSYMHKSNITTPSRNTYERFTYLNLYGNLNKKDPAFNFGQQTESNTIGKINTDVIDLVTNSSYDREDKHAESSTAYGGNLTGLSSRKSLNIPSSAASIGCERGYATVPHLKRQPLSSAKVDMSSANTTDTTPRRTSTTIQEVEEQQIADNEKISYADMERRAGIVSNTNTNCYNGSIDGISNFPTNKRQKLINGSTVIAADIRESNEGFLGDSASESDESGIDVIKTKSSTSQQRKTGLFNTSAGGKANTRNSSRTSSFGNGLNFYSHLDGRKSLFSGQNHVNALNNSTMSLTSLNRRQFNASIYGSTSALSDSRLLNTFSPFYKGKTTYGGAAAYNKYAASTGACGVRITPTLIRPTSSLSSLSTSSNPLANNVNSQVCESSAISSTAKRILDLINDFATPLSEVKKMASNLKTNPRLNIPTQAKSRLNESDLNASRAIRLSQVQSPYSRPTVILQPSGNASGRGKAGGVLPPVKELQVPTMSQLLQMKKMQNTTEKARETVQKSGLKTVISDYTLPDFHSLQTKSSNICEGDQQKHSNKIKNKMRKALRSSSTNLYDEDPPPPVNLPNISFPLMKSVPKIDIEINNPPVPGKTKSEKSSSILASNIETSQTESKPDSSKSTSSAFQASLTQPSLSITDNRQEQLHSKQSISTSKSSNIFTFSAPLKIDSILPPSQSVMKNEIGKYKFSRPLDVVVPDSSNSFKVHNTQPKQPQLKEGSCLEVLSKRFVFAQKNNRDATTDTSSSEGSVSLSTGFGNQFQKSSNEWDCETCMVRNKSDKNKCAACETSRNQNSSLSQQPLNSIISVTASSFGNQFSKSLNEWECDACMIRNKEDVTKCVACETPRNNSVVQVTPALPYSKNSFGDVFKQNTDTWECQTCMISNKNALNECIACQAKKPGCTNNSQSGVSQNRLKVGFVGSGNKNIGADVGFKTLAAQQKVSSWECDACMTRNNANRTKCACCEQPKPGSSIAETTNESANKFQFGATAASTFTFGFGTGAKSLKEEDLRKELSKKIGESEKPLESTLESSTAQPAHTLGSFKFGCKPDSLNSSDCKNDQADGNTQVKGFKFGISAMDGAKVVEKSNVLSLSPPNFAFCTKPLSTAAITTTTTIPIAATTVSTPTTSTSIENLSSATTTSTSSVKSSWPCKSASANANNNEKTQVVASPLFGLDTSTASSTTGGFSFGNKMEKNSVAAAEEKKKTADNIAFKAPTTAVTTKNSSFSFGSSTVNSSTAISAPIVSSTFNATTSSTTATSITTAAMKPIFTFGTSTSTPSDISSQATPAFSSFNFGINSTVASTTANTLFAGVSSTITATANTNTRPNTSLATSSTLITTPASTNIFGSFSGGASLSTSATPLFGSSVNPPANNNLSTVSSSTNIQPPSNTQFEAFGSKTTSNVFGSVSGVELKANESVKPIESKPTIPVFGNIPLSSTTQSSQSSGFVFGSNKANTTVTTTVPATSTVATASTTWPKSSFAFGSNTPTTSPIIAAAPVNASENKEVPKASIFGTFSSCNTNTNNQQKKSSIFGTSASNNTGAPLSASVTTTGPTSFSTNLFSTNSAPAATSIFGANSIGNATTPASSLSSSPFGGAALPSGITPTFGTTAALGTTFGSFGGSTSKTTTSSATEIKKSEAAFNFGVASTAQNTSGGFSFGSSTSTTKPAFNFGGSSTGQQPSFNFTGTNESQSSAKPFQFGATPSAPAFNFNRTVLEGTSNAPFQFNAGATPVSSNIFAPTLTPGAQTAQQAKRKIRVPMKRVTPR